MSPELYCCMFCSFDIYSHTLMKLDMTFARIFAVVSARISVGTNRARMLKWLTMVVMFGDSSTWSVGILVILWKELKNWNRRDHIEIQLLFTVCSGKDILRAWPMHGLICEWHCRPGAHGAVGKKAAPTFGPKMGVSNYVGVPDVILRIHSRIFNDCMNFPLHIIDPEMSYVSVSVASSVSLWATVENYKRFIAYFWRHNW